MRVDLVERKLQFLGEILMFRILILVASLVATPALAGSFFQYTDDQGTVCYTDDFDRVPDKYFDQTVERTSEELEKSVEKRWTEVHKEK